MKISEIMHKGVNYVNINESVKKVAQLMRKENVWAVPIVENDRPVGFVTDRDIVINCVDSGFDMNQPISHAMTEDPVCVIPDQNIDEATKLMEDRQISRLLVVDENQRPIRMVGLQDLSQVDMGKSAEALSEIKRQ